MSDNPRFALIRHTHSSVRPRHPSTNRLHQLWEILFSNVDPLTEVVYVPSLRLLTEKAAKSPEVIPRALEALMVAIHGSAVVSLGRDGCEQEFAEPRDGLLSQYISATETALSQASLTETTSMIVLQALVIHLITVRDVYTPRADWTLIGVAIRIAQGIDLERDGKYLGLSPFEAEIRGRIWFQLDSHDSRVAELCSLSKYRDPDVGPQRAEWPTNVNDDQLHARMNEIPLRSNRLTDAVFVVTRCEMGKFAAARIAAL
ncbi:hypothetical protein G6011_08915 [Alternaria panax]|uniref:Xylanolytic transcriptional activator regulatory domain-containing protein n=1 Tax=Alternaria panax TaxID=48097 RepID=A0AAD4IA48_9PLEO|nr:hypothetical protein G6011_08915 [Alternaria panax]